MQVREGHLDGLYAFGGTDLEDRTLRALGCLHAGRKTCGIDLAGIARKLEPDHEILRDGTAAPLLDREAVQIGREVDRPFEGDCPYLRIVGSLSSPSCQ